LDKDDKFDAVVLDITIPGGLGGKDIIEEIKELDPDVKAVVTSGYSEDPVMAHYKDYGFEARLKKPFALQDFKNALYNITS